VTGAREEVLLTGELGLAGVDLLYRTVAQVARMRNLPPPPGHGSWDDDAIIETCNEVFAGREGHARFVALAASSYDEDSFRAGVWTAVVRDIVSQGRRTERGSLAERVRDVLNDVPDVVEAHGGWTISSVDRSLPEPRYDELVAAAASTPIIVPPWSEESERRSPLADRPSFMALITAVLSHCPDGLPLSQLVDVLAVRLGVHDLPVPHDHTMLDEYGLTVGIDPARATALQRDAVVLLEALTPAQRLVLPHLGASATEISGQTGLGRTKAWTTTKEVHAILDSQLREHPDRDAVLRIATELLVDTEGGH
jgi:hypothetical protein